MDFLKRIFSNRKLNVFDKFDIENYHYQILIKNIRHGSNKSAYFLDNQVAIEKLSKKWKLPLAESVCRGGYDFSINIFRDNELVELSLVCFECDSWSIQNSSNLDKSLFKISQREFQDFLQNYFREIEIKEKKFSDRNKALIFWEKEKCNPKLIQQHQLLPDWMRFEGEYTLNFFLQNLNSKINPTDYLEEKIKSFGDCGEYEFGQLMAAGNDEGYKYTFIMKSSKKLFEKIDEFSPEMLVKNNPKPKGLFNKDWSSFDDFNLELYYEK